MSIADLYYFAALECFYFTHIVKLMEIERPDAMSYAMLNTHVPPWFNNNSNLFDYFLV